ncbi:putative pentatricopeptide [Rosa chinensis]|uniref:Putative pentatricopeptide n=1 Tax=Rosa chinensis TaxID=74649 RepID=A0A2P6R356_ROSCH|nr:pentatricopeptide repeat-containing protein At1g26900, mitochondrial [Rosa chinensis]PRQ40809.1 putative pentatricopeptide [Rosa chinensis]
MTQTLAVRLGQRLNLWPWESAKLISLLECCKQVSEISQIHGSMVKTGLDHNPFAMSKLLASSVHHIQYAASIFGHIRNPNRFMFNTLLRAYSISDEPKQAFLVFNNLRARNIVLDQFSFTTALKACARELASGTGQGIHGVVVRSGHGGFITVKNTLLHFYCVCGKIEDAHHLFDEFPQRNDLISWNTLMGGYLHISQPRVIVDLFKEMCIGGFEASVTTVLYLLSAIGELGSYLGGESVHGYCIKMGFSYNLHVVTALIDVYAKNGEIDLARRIFDGVAVKDVVLWNCLVDKYAKCGMVEEAVALLRLMKLERTKPNSSTLAGLLSACAASGSVSVGRFIKDYVEEERLVLDAVLGTALVDMYAKCGFLDKALDIFESMENRDVKSWTAMISGYGVHGEAGNALRLFYRMEAEGCQPNEVTFLAVLSACGHAGLVREGVSCFEMMVCKYGFVPKVEHYGCMIDLLGRAGLLEEAHNLIESLPIKSDVTAWRALLSACRVYGYVALGEVVQRVLAELNDDHPTNAMLLSGTYAIAGRLHDNTNMQKTVEGEMVREENPVKEAGLSTIELDS